MSDIQGYLTVVSLDGTDITAQLSDVSMSQAKSVESKPTMDGTGDPLKLVTSKSGTLDCSGQVDDAGFPGLAATWAKDTEIAFTLQVGDGSALDAGDYAGSVTLSAFDIEATPDDTWNFTLSGETRAVVYTPPT